MAEKVELKGAKNGDFNGAMGFRKRSNIKNVIQELDSSRVKASAAGIPILESRLV